MMNERAEERSEASSGSCNTRVQVIHAAAAEVNRGSAQLGTQHSNDQNRGSRRTYSQKRGLEDSDNTADGRIFKYKA
ncbi:hypothetical protein RRG08_044862 [Elysia crispata]|uniref:Uncharacterized protein n=1 Tax=Elysia crispata TaxID=231223 RepID=A0AAE1A3H5_9GAST|nr:hypothetical protein RRG08_044862 [Elysia crispata]